MKKVLALSGLAMLGVLSWKLVSRDDAPPAKGLRESRGASARGQRERIAPGAEAAAANEAEATIRALRQEIEQKVNAPPDEVMTVRLESALEAVTQRLPDGVQTELACASTMCRLVPRGSAEDVGVAANQVTENAPKLFTGAMVLPTADGESTVFVARDPGALDLLTPSAAL